MKTLKKQKVALEILRSACQEVESPDEAQVIVSLLNSILEDYDGKYVSIAAPETNVLKKVSIIRMPNFQLDLVNPRIVETSGRLLSFGESCISFTDLHLNCFRHESITIENGLNKELIQLKDYPSLIVQHEIDHLNGVIFQDRTIKFALVRSGGKINDSDFCPCGSRKRFKVCCQKT